MHRILKYFTENEQGKLHFQEYGIYADVPSNKLYSRHGECYIDDFGEAFAKLERNIKGGCFWIGLMPDGNKTAFLKAAIIEKFEPMLIELGLYSNSTCHA